VSRINYLERYLAQSAELLRNLPVASIDAVIEALVVAWKAERFIYVMGNGGSAANAEHFVNDLGKGEARGFSRRFKIMGLTSNVSLLTAWANDTDYEHVFAEQLRNFVARGDVVMAISGSGNSRNVVNAVELGRERGAVTVGLAGFDGGKLKHLCDHCIVVPSNNMQHIEDMHLTVLHAIYSAIKDTCVGLPDTDQGS
jgi:D-sedoheptulose 7-phosphate isomerase